MSTKVLALVATAIAASSWLQPASACSYPEPIEFRESIERASSIFIFRLEAAELRNSDHSEWIEGRIRVVQILKGDASSFKNLRFSTDWCGGLRLDVGHYFIIVTSSRGATIDLEADDKSVLDISEFYDEAEPAVIAPVLRPIHEFLAGHPLPANYPPLVLMNRTSTAPLPPTP